MRFSTNQIAGVTFIAQLFCLQANSQSILIPNSRADGNSTTIGNTTTAFTGTAYIDDVYRGDNITITNVVFSPGARTFWHRHESGQALRIIAGAGWMSDRDGVPVRLQVGDVAWCPPGVVHWHGADESSMMAHLAIAHGQTEWLEEVSDEEFQLATV